MTSKGLLTFKYTVMLSFDFSIDLHCHPTYKPLGKTYASERGRQGNRPADRTSLWFYDPPTESDKLLNKLTGLTKFSQTNLTASVYGQVWAMVVSLGSIEKWFFCNRTGGDGLFKDMMADFAVGIGIKRINAIQGTKDYFSDLLEEYRFMEQMQDQPVMIDGKKCSYRIVHNFEELEQVMLENESAMKLVTHKNKNDLPPITLALIPSIEGLHVLNCGLDKPCSEQEVLENLQLLKKHPHRPWFVTFSHHFYNELCGHALSLSGKMAKRCNQLEGLGTGFTPLGLKVLDTLLDDTNGDRILVDLKHLSPKARGELMEIRSRKYPNLPLLISHGACNGLPDSRTPFSKYPELGNDMHNGEINFYDDEIIAVAKSGGIMGLQLDERRIASKERLQETKGSLALNKRMHYRSQLIWNQVQYVAELLDDNGMFAWGTLAMGSDFDGIVDPVNTFWTFEEYIDIKSYLERHAHNYVSTQASRLKNSFNRISADTIVQRLFQENAWSFFEKWCSVRNRIPFNTKRTELQPVVMELGG